MTASSAERRATQLFALLALSLPFAVLGITDHVWEDWFITFRMSENLAEGHGLSYHPGEPIHGFTSPLGVLLPALCHLLTGRTSWLASLWLFRVLCVMAWAGGGLLLLDAARRAGLAPAARLFLGAAYLVEAKTLTFCTSGMETAFVVLFLALGLRSLVMGVGRDPSAMGLAWAGLQWTRPDGFVLAGALGVGALLFSGPRGPTLRGLLRAAFLAALLYGPWLVIATACFGSPIPHTIKAKALPLGAALLELHVRLPWVAYNAYTPPYLGFSNAPAAEGLGLASRLLVLAATCVALWPRAPGLTRAAGLVTAITTLYLAFVSVYPWYLPPVAVAGLVALAGVVEAGDRGPRRAWTRGVAALVVALLAVQLGLTARLLAAQRRLVEDSVRAPVGGWLRRQVAPGERVMLEPLGWIGYFAGARMVDVVGLVSPEVVRLKRAGANLDDLVERLHPEWLVLRPDELRILKPSTRARYVVAAEYDARPRIRESGLLGAEWLLHDGAFVVLRGLDQRQKERRLFLSTSRSSAVSSGDR